MARSEAKHRSGSDDVMYETVQGGEKDSMYPLADRLRSVSLAGVSREEQSVIRVLAHWQYAKPTQQFDSCRLVYHFRQSSAT